MKKFFTFLGVFALCTSVNAETVKMLSLGLGQPGIDEPGMMGMAISADGRYVCGTLEYGFGYFVGDLTTEKYAYAITDDDEGAELRHVDNNGLAIGFNGPGVTYSLDGVETVLATPDGYRYVLGEDITNDGSLMVGSLVANDYGTFAAYSKNGGEWTLLPKPSDEEMGVFANDGFTAAKHVSGDGRVIAGYVGSFGPAMVWIMNENGEYEPDALFARYLITDETSDDDARKFINLATMNISNNGKYVLLQGTMMNGDDLSDTVVVAAVYDTETKSLKIYDEPQEIDEAGMGLCPSAIADDGTFIGVIGQPMMGSTGSFIMKAGETQAKYLMNVYPEYAAIFMETDQYGNSVPMDISADGKKIIGYAYYCEDFSAEDSIPYFTTWVIDSTGTVAVESIATDSIQPEAVYSIDGRKQNGLKKGINIIRMSDGSVKKIINR